MWNLLGVTERHLEWLTPSRRLEWWLASYTVAFGMYLVLEGEALHGPRYAVMLSWAPAPIWGALSCVIGVFHAWALYINGRCFWTSYVRVLATALNAGLFTFAFGAVLSTTLYYGEPTNVTLLYSFAAVWVSVCAFTIATRDAHRTYERRRKG